MADDGLASVLIREAERPPKTIANRTWNRRVEFGAALATPICETDLSCFQFSLHTSRCACGVQHCTAGLGIWEWASSDEGGEPDVLMIDVTRLKAQRTTSSLLKKGLLPSVLDAPKAG